MHCPLLAHGIGYIPIKKHSTRLPWFIDAIVKGGGGRGGDSSFCGAGSEEELQGEGTDVVKLGLGNEAGAKTLRNWGWELKPSMVEREMRT